MFTGLIAFPITPADPDGRVDVDALRRLVRRLVDGDADAVCVLGSTGTYAYLTRHERLRAVEAAVAEAGGRKPVLAGVGALRTDEAVGLARDALGAGAAGGLLAAVSYTPPTQEEIFAHFAAVAGSGLPLCIYDNPGTTHVTLGDDLLERLSGIDGVRALKTPAPAGPEAARRVRELRARLRAGVSLGFAVDWHAAEALIAGGDAWYSVLAGLFPAPAAGIVRAAARGDAEAARRLSQELEPVWSLFQSFGSLRVMHAAAVLSGVAADLPRPLLPLRGEPARAVARTLGQLSAVLGAAPLL